MATRIDLMDDAQAEAFLDRMIAERRKTMPDDLRARDPDSDYGLTIGSNTGLGMIARRYQYCKRRGGTRIF